VRKWCGSNISKFFFFSLLFSPDSLEQARRQRGREVAGGGRRGRERRPARWRWRERRRGGGQRDDDDRRGGARVAPAGERSSAAGTDERQIRLAADVTSLSLARARLSWLSMVATVDNRQGGSSNVNERRFKEEARGAERKEMGRPASRR
jgi:hypothetical protein